MLKVDLNKVKPFNNKLPGNTQWVNMPVLLVIGISSQAVVLSVFECDGRALVRLPSGHETHSYEVEMLFGYPIGTEDYDMSKIADVTEAVNLLSS